MKRYSAYKPSNIKELGEIPKHWEIKKLKYVAKLKSGESINSESIKEFDVFPVYGGNGLRGFTNSYTHEGSYVLIGRQGALCGNINYATGRFWASEHAVVATIRNKENFVWLGELLRTMNLNQYSISAAQPGIAVERIKELVIPIPPINEQNNIAQYLDIEVQKIDSLIAIKQKLIALLKEERSAVINHAVTKGINVDVAMKDSGIEWLDQTPKHWNIYPFSVMFKEHKHKNKGNIIKKVLSLSYGKIVIRNIENNFGLLPESFEGYNIVDAGNIVLRLTDLQNDHKSLRCGLVKVQGIITSAYTTIECNKRINAEYAYYLLHLYDLLKVFYGMGGGVRQSMDYSDLKKMPILLPPYEEQVEIVRYVNSMITKIDNSIIKMLKEISLLQEYRTALISEVVTGKIDVRQEVVT